MDKKRLTINMASTLVSFLVNIGISFFLTPYILNTVGKEAYGFVGLANDFVSYAQLVVIALNSMASRFITIRLHKKDIEGANNYFTSTFIADLFLSTIMIIPCIIVIAFINIFINVPDTILLDVRLLWSFIFLNFIISIITAVFGIAPFARNRLEISSKISIITNILRFIMIFLLFYLFKPSVWYIGFVSFICAIFSTIYDVYYSKKLLPEIKINKKYFNIKYVKELISVGIWNTIGSLNSILMTGIDLLISNIFMDAAAMGILAIVKVVPNFLNNLVLSIVSAFVPQLTIDYAKNNKSELFKNIESSIVIISFFTSLPIGIFLSSSDIFYKLWVGNQYNINYIQLLVVLSAGGMIITSSISIFNNVLTAANKVKFNSIMAIISGIINVILVFILLKTTKLGLIVIAGTSTIIVFIRNFTITPIYTSKVLKLKWNAFYPVMFRNILFVVISILVSILLKNFININNWFAYGVYFVLCCIICLILFVTILLKNKEKKLILNIIKKVIKNERQ